MIKTRTLAAAVLAFGLAACGTDKAKPDLSKDLATSMDAAEAVGGRWTEVQLVESPHPYGNRYSQTYEARGSADATEMRVVLERFELEAGYDFLSVAGAAEVLHRLTGTRSGDELVIPGNLVRFRFDTDQSVTGWGFKVRVFERAACTCSPYPRQVCGADGQTYLNECEATCAGVRVAYPGTCRAEAWFGINRTIESAHPYTNTFTNTWTVREAGASAVRVHFSRLDLERGYDFVRILDGADRVVASYTGKQADFNSAVVQGDTLKVELTTDRSVTNWGFAIDSYEVTGGCNADSECGAGKVCAQVQCIRAPCFNLCEDAPTAQGYTDITLADLNADPTAFSGQRIRVTAEPTVRALCTRRACSEANPCCNVCSGSFVIGQQVTLRDASDQAYGCRGNECNWRGTCREFPPENTGPYTFEGQLRVEATGTVALLVESFEAAACQVAGCSSQVCANTPNVITTCEARPEYLCYQRENCEIQAQGHCGWTETPQYLQCLADFTTERASATDVPLSIPDDDAQGATSQVSVRGTGTISQLLISLQITHTYRGDLLVSLFSPTGTEVVLHAGDGGSANDLVILDREIPELSGEQKNGTWRLVVKDRYERDTGTLEGWTLTFR